MKTLSPDEIECLVGARPSSAHPLDILGYGYTSEGARRFRAEKPDFLPQIVAHVESVLVEGGVFPEGANPDNPGFGTFITVTEHRSGLAAWRKSALADTSAFQLAACRRQKPSVRMSEE
jgi:hypothetical protein